jgi:hypothetical protein
VTETEAVWWKEGGFYIAKPDGRHRVHERCLTCNTELREMDPKRRETTIALTEFSDFRLPDDGEIESQTTESFRDLRIAWIHVTKMEGAGLGHGVQFRYPGSKGMLVAFIDGFGWYHKVNDYVRVIILSPNSESWNSYTANPKIVLGPLKDYVRLVLKGKKIIPDGATKNDIFCHVNG